MVWYLEDSEVIDKKPTSNDVTKKDKIDPKLEEEALEEVPIQKSWIDKIELLHPQIEIAECMLKHNQIKEENSKNNEKYFKKCTHINYNDMLNSFIIRNR